MYVDLQNLLINFSFSLCAATIQQSLFIKSGFLCLCCSIDEVNNLREIQAMRRLNPHGNVVDLKDIIL